MSKIYCVVNDDGRIVFTKNSRFGQYRGPIDPDDMITKDEVIRFIKYLREKENPVILHHRHVVGFLNRHTVDSFDGRSRILESIKECGSAEEAYVLFAKITNGGGCVDRKIRASFPCDLFYEEDFCEYLMSIGMGKEEAAFFSDLVARGGYKDYAKSQKKGQNVLYGISPELDLFARSACLASRSSVFETFEYEYALFKKEMRKRLADSLPDPAERNRMNALSYINSKDIRAHLEKTGYVFSALETAWLIFQCRDLTMKEKHAAWGELIETMPDCEIPERNHMTPHIPSLHGFLKKYISDESMLAERFFEKQDGYVFEVETLREGKNGRPAKGGGFTGVFSSFEKFTEAYKTALAEPDDYTGGFFIRKVPVDGTKAAFEAFLNPLLQICEIRWSGSDFRDLGKSFDVFKGMWFDFPTPFSKGDIVYNPVFPTLLTVLTGVNNDRIKPLNEKIIERRKLHGDDTDIYRLF